MIPRRRVCGVVRRRQAFRELRGAICRLSLLKNGHPLASIMLTNRIQELAAAKAKVAELEASLVAERRQALLDLPGQLGYASVAELIKALRGADRGGKSPRKPRAAAAPKAGDRKRARITDETRTEVKKLVEEGKSGAEIAAKLGISLPSVQNVKKALGLVKPRK